MRGVLSLVAAVLLAGTACSGPAPDSSSERPTIRWGVGERVTTMDPANATHTVERMLSMMLFDGLVRYKTSDIRQPFEPGIATEVPEPQMENGQQVWTIPLRHGVMCPAGRKTEAYELTAEDVVFSLDRARDPERSNVAAQYGAYDSVTAVDPYTVRIALAYPQSPRSFLSTITNFQGGLVVCRKAVEAEGDDFGMHPVGTGPFRFTDFVPEQKIEVAANDSFVDGTPLAAGWEIRFMPDATARRAALLSGDLDVVDTLSAPNKWLESIDQQDGFKSVSADLFGTNYVLFNTKEGPTADIRVRQALSYAINRDDYLAGAEPGLVAPTVSVWPDALPGGVADAHTVQAGLVVDFDLAKARALLAEAGHPDGFALTATAPGDAGDYQILQAQLKEIGVDLTIRTVDFPTWQQAMLTGHEPIMVTVTAFRPTPQVAYETFFYGPSAVLGGAQPAQNFSGYAGADALIEAARTESDPGRQADLWQQVNDQILRDVVMKPLMVSRTAYASVCGFTWGGVEPPVAIPGNWQASHRATVDRAAEGC
ncbi:MAG: ABC transporter substrate-binding protein [Pseudonocardia sp.]